MLYMNVSDIEWACYRYASHPILAGAARFLRQFKEQVNENSDGWAYWKAPVKAAAKLMRLLQNPPVDVTRTDVKRSITPIKSFYTRKGTAAGMRFPTIEY